MDLSKMDIDFRNGGDTRNSSAVDDRKMKRGGEGAVYATLQGAGVDQGVNAFNARRRRPRQVRAIVGWVKTDAYWQRGAKSHQ
jgi:hypothetical protein